MTSPSQNETVSDRAHTASLPALDGLRGLCAFMVVFFHFHMLGYVAFDASLGLLGVMLFFSLSGFLMAYHYMPGRFHIRYWLAFYMRRFFRVYPAFTVTLLLCWMAGVITQDPELLHVFSPAGVIRHLELLTGYYTFWTIPVELIFYLFFPAIACFLLTLEWVCIAPLLALFLIWIYMILFSTGEALWFFAYFVGGMTMALYHKRYPLYPEKHGGSALALCLLTIIAGYCLTEAGDIHHTKIWRYPWLFSPLTALTVFAFARASGPVQRFFSSAPARFFGRISYSLYLVHIWILMLGTRMLPWPMLPKALFLLAIIFVTSAVLYYLIERPFNYVGKILSGKISPA